jgi:hypothetical protein
MTIVAIRDYLKTTIELECWARVQCKFLDLFSTNKRLHAQTALEMIQPLYQVERHVKSFTAEQREQYRQQTAQPITQQLLAWLQTQRSASGEWLGQSH